MTSNQNLTEKEFAALEGIDVSEYGDSLLDPVWSFSIVDNSLLPASSIGGVVASLLKKGYVHCAGEGNGACIGMTAAGVREYLRLTEGRCKKWLPTASGRYDESAQSALLAAAMNFK